MKKFFLVAVGLGVAVAAVAAPLNPRTETVVLVSDGDSFTTPIPDRVRLLGINAPEMARDRQPAEPYAEQARAALLGMIGGKQVRLEFGTQLRDRYKRLIAHVYLPDGTWINGKMIEDGNAFVYSFADNRIKIKELLELEQKARTAGKGLWQEERWKSLPADRPFPEKLMGDFAFVEGRVKKVDAPRSITYLNFGDDWGQDFTVEIRPEHLQAFLDDNIDPIYYYPGRQVRVRGVLKPVNGVLMTVTHPEQIETLD